jgi:hypothetical protein
MLDLLDLLSRYGPDPGAEAHLLQLIEVHRAAVRASMDRYPRDEVAQAEAAVEANPAAAFHFDAGGFATLAAPGRSWQAGHFETPSIGTLRQRAAARGSAGGARARLWLLDGRSEMTDIGCLQATSSAGTLFQVASQFNCLESPGPWVTRVANYFHDATQGPRASISAFPATLLRHYQAPGPDGSRFTQVSGGPQINLLADACPPGVVHNGYLTGRGVDDPPALAAALEADFDRIRVGVHDGAQVVRGYSWDGAVEDSERRRIAQVFTSTAAGGGYGADAVLGESFLPVCRQLLRAACLGTLLAAAALGRRRVLLTLIGGGVFGNPINLIWETILAALIEAEPLLPHDLDVVLNGFSLGAQIDLRTILPAVRERGGVILAFDRMGQATVLR